MIIKDKNYYAEGLFSGRFIYHNPMTAAEVPTESATAYITIKEEVTGAPEATAAFAGAWLMCMGEIFFVRTSASHEGHCVHNEEDAKIRSKQ